MATHKHDYAAEVRKYAPNADEGHIAGIVKHCGIALQSRDASLVAASDPKELARVRDGFMKKKLALPGTDAELDASLMEVMTVMKGDHQKHRVAVYYLLAEKFGKLDLFAPKTK
jgi:hypothetical protein